MFKKKLMKKIVPSALIFGVVVTGAATNANANANIMKYKEYYTFSKVGYTATDVKRKTGSNAVCNNESISNATYHSAVLVNGEYKIRSSEERVNKGKRVELDTSKKYGSDKIQAQEGKRYQQKHTTPKLGVVASGTFSVDNKYDF